MIRSPILQQWSTDIAVLRARAAKLTDGLTPAQMHARPANGGWSIAMVLEHLLVTDGLYTPIVDRLIAAAPHTGTTEAWQPSLVGKLLFWSLSPKGVSKMKAPRKMQPGPAPRADVVAQYLANLDSLANAVARVDGLPIGTIRLSSPVMPLARMNLGDALRIAIVHSQRHLNQVERVRHEVVGSSQS